MLAAIGGFIANKLVIGFGFGASSGSPVSLDLMLEMLDWFCFVFSVDLDSGTKG